MNSGYKEFISQFVELCNSHFDLQRLSKLGDSEGEAAESLTAKLENSDIEKINQLFKHVTIGGVYQTLELLEELIEDGDLKLLWKGTELPNMPYGEELCSDWLSQCVGERWPDESTCPIHKDQTLIVEAVPIVYGLIRHSSDYYDAEKANFPLANAVVEGGCLVGQAKYENRPYCESCRRELAKWLMDNDLTVGIPKDTDSFFKRYGKKA
jgi:hypothetical protein